MKRPAGDLQHLAGRGGVEHRVEQRAVAGLPIWLLICMAREVGPILWSMTRRPSAIWRATQARLTR